MPRFTATSKSGPPWGAVNVTMSALVVALAATVWDHLGGFPSLVLSVVAVAATLGFLVHGLRIGVPAAHIAYRIALAVFVTLWPIWYTSSTTVFVPLIGLLVLSVALILVAPVAAGAGSADPDDTELADLVTPPAIPPPVLTITVVDVAADAIDAFGSRASAEYIAGRELPEHDWRLNVVCGTSETTLFRGATADDVAALIERDRREGRVQ